MSASREGRRAEILLVEDNEDDAVLVRLALGRLSHAVSLHHVTDGAACLRFLRRQPPWPDAPPVDLVLLDLNMPGVDGRAALAEIVRDEALVHLPVVVLTTSTRQEDVREIYRLRCSGYVAKPLDLDRFYQVVERICGYWLDTVELPRPHG